MQNKDTRNDTQQRKTLTASLLGSPTSAKASGAAFSLATVLPVAFSLIVLVVLAVTGLSEQEGYAQKDWYLYVSYLLSPISFALVACWYLRYTRTPVCAALREQKCKPRYFLVALLLQIGLLSLSELNSLFLEFLSKFGYTDSGIFLPSMNGFGFVGVLLVVALLPAVFEEIMFRGILLKGLGAFKTTGAVLICGALFSLYHQNPAQTIYQFCCGAAFALVAIRSGSVLPTVLAHFVNNAVILILTKFGVSEFSAPVFITIVVISAVCLVLSLVYLVFLDENKPSEETPLRETEIKTERKNFWICAAVGIAVCVLTWLLVLVTGM